MSRPTPDELAAFAAVAEHRRFRQAADARGVSRSGYRYNAFKIELAKRSIVRALSEVSAA